MASLREYRSDIMLIYERLKLSKDKRLTELHTQFLIHKYRAMVINDDFKANRQIDPATLQDFGKVVFTKVTSADDPNVPYGSVNYGKLTIPQVITLPDDRGVYHVASSSKLCQHYPLMPPLFFNVPAGSVAAKSRYYTRINTALYIDHFAEDGNVILILDNPMDGVVLLTENVLAGSIKSGISYTVQSGQVVYNGISYNVGQAFTGIFGIATFTGTGVVKHTTQKRAMTIDDNYPLSFKMAERVLINMFYQEFKIEAQQTSDIRNDAQDQLTVLQSQQP